MEEEEELLECNGDQRGDSAMCETATAPSQPSTPAEHLDDAARELAGGHPPGWGVLRDPDEGIDQTPDEGTRAAAAAPPRHAGPTIGPLTGPIAPARRRGAAGGSPTELEAARKDASEDAFDWRVSGGGPYVYGEHIEGTGFHPATTTFGFGVGHDPEHGGDMLHAHVGAGRWRDQDGEEYEGFRLHGGVIGGNLSEDTNVGIGTFDVGAYSTDETFTAGIQASAGEAATTYGGEGGNGDTSLRVGASEGPGLAFRAHYGDADGDGIRERGVGFDLGPVSADLRSEYLGRAWDSVFGD